MKIDTIADIKETAHDVLTMKYELTALASLERNVKFWFDSCGYDKEQVIRQIEKWVNFAYSPGEQEKAKEEVLGILKNDSK